MLEDFNDKNPGRRSTGSLYSAAELRAAEGALARRGFMPSNDNRGSMGARIYQRKDGAYAAVFLDELGCDAESSGLMCFFDSDGKQSLAPTAVHHFARCENPGIVSALRAVVAPFFPKR